jgi:hypothetical protein
VCAETRKFLEVLRATRDVAAVASEHGRRAVQESWDLLRTAPFTGRVK